MVESARAVRRGRPMETGHSCGSVGLLPLSGNFFSELRPSQQPLNLLPKWLLTGELSDILFLPFSRGPCLRSHQLRS